MGSGKSTGGVGPRKGRPRNALRARRWKDLISAWERSGLSQVEFCRRKRVSVHTFRWWRYTTRVSGDDQRAEPVEEGAGLPPLVELKVVPPEATVGAARVSIEVPCGSVIHVRPGFDPGVLKEVLAILGARSC